ncbi:MAG: zinc ribbon domain-containing protein [Variovorax sp.]|nr:MAG: zinc ribbon domain-containing protein [Variovorax sp.]
MALVCPACGTENRAVAKFCIECIGPLQPDFEPTQVLSRRAASESTTLRGMPTALAEFGSAAPASAPAPAPATAPRRTGAAEPRKGLWLSVAAFAITLLVGAGGWMIAGAGGWYIYTASASPNATPAAEDALAAPKVAVVAPAPPAPPVTAEPAVLAPVAVAPLLAAPAVAPSASPAPAPAARPTTVAKVRPATREAPPRTAVVGDPGTACADLGFLGKARCMAAQCAKSEFRGHSACQAVLAHQRLMEEKRNPTLAN